jgi:hypothetical protein
VQGDGVTRRQQLTESHQRHTVEPVSAGVVGPLTVAGTLLAATAILLESALSFLCFGIRLNELREWVGVSPRSYSNSLVVDARCGDGTTKSRGCSPPSRRRDEQRSPRP